MFQVPVRLHHPLRDDCCTPCFGLRLDKHKWPLVCLGPFSSAFCLGLGGSSAFRRTPFPSAATAGCFDTGRGYRFRYYGSPLLNEVVLLQIVSLAGSHFASFVSFTAFSSLCRGPRWRVKAADRRRTKPNRKNVNARWPDILTKFRGGNGVEPSYVVLYYRKTPLSIDDHGSRPGCISGPALGKLCSLTVAALKYTASRGRIMGVPVYLASSYFVSHERVPDRRRNQHIRN